MIDWLCANKYTTNKKATNSGGQAPLYAAACNRHLEVVRLLFLSRVETDVLAAGRPTVSRRSAEKGHAEIVRLLLE